MLRILTREHLDVLCVVAMFQSLSRDVEDSDAILLLMRQAIASSNPSAGMLRILTPRALLRQMLHLCSNPSAGMLRILTAQQAQQALLAQCSNPSAGMLRILTQTA